MADRVLTWHIEPMQGSPDDPQGPIYILDRSYAPLRWLVAVKNAIQDKTQPLEFDIKSEGASIFSERPSVANDEPELLIEEGAEGFAEDAALEKDSAVACYLIGTGGANGITISLELEALGEW